MKDATRKMLSVRLRLVIHQLLDEAHAQANVAAALPLTRTDVVELAIQEYAKKILKKNRACA